MQYLQWNSISSIIIIYVYTAPYVMADTYHIVTSPSSPCPGEFIGEPCLTLQQYAASPSQDSNVTLIIESGTHRLQHLGELTTGSGVDYFTMTAVHVQKGAAHIVFYAPSPIDYYYYNYNIRTAYALTFIHISFSCSTDSICALRFYDVQQLFIEDCTFQGVKLYLDDVSNTKIF